ncbi:MAG: hypothetical protein QXX57_03080, partial [Nitrososphaerota archaeon]
QKADSLRQAYKVTEDEFIEASQELEELFKGSKLDADKITVEDVVDYASLKPHVSKVKDLLAPFEENIEEDRYGEVVSSLARPLRDGKLKEAEVLEIIRRNFQVEEKFRDLNTKVYGKETQSQGRPSKVKEPETESFETFDDF